MSRKRSYKILAAIKKFKDSCRGAFCGTEKYVYFLNKEGYDKILELSAQVGEKMTVSNKEELDDFVDKNGFRIKLGSEKVHSKLLDKELLELDTEFKETAIEPLIKNSKNIVDYSELFQIKKLVITKISEHCPSCKSKLDSISAENCFIYFSGVAGKEITIEKTVDLSIVL